MIIRIGAVLCVFVGVINICNLINITAAVINTCNLITFLTKQLYSYSNYF